MSIPGLERKPENLMYSICNIRMCIRFQIHRHANKWCIFAVYL